MIERASPGMSTEDGYRNGESGPAVSTERDSPAESPGGGQQKRGPPAPPGAKRSRRSVQKRVVSVPIEGGGGGEGLPPPDSWAWRKYGQKPIKGSPYPRGYYRCSSSKGCSARKQVERSRLDPAMLLVTYSFDHDHPCPQPKNQALADDKPPSPPPAEADELAEPEAPEHKFVEPEVTVEMPETPAREACGGEERFEWFDQMSLESMGPYAPTFEALDVALPLPLPLPLPEEWDRELQGEDALFAGLGELPECAFVFGRRRDLGLAAAASCS